MLQACVQVWTSLSRKLLSNIVEKSLKINFIPLNETVYALLTQTGKWHHTTTLFLHAN